MSEWIKKNKISIGIIIILSIVLCIFYFSKQSVKSNNDFSLQTKCAGLARGYFDEEYNKYVSPPALDYKNHFNSKLNKCLILISLTGDSQISIDLYDVLEGKHYAAFVGSLNCYPYAYQIEKCQGNYGAIWFDGNDGKDPTFTLNQMDIKNTQEKFMGHIQSFMND